MCLNDAQPSVNTVLKFHSAVITVTLSTPLPITLEQLNSCSEYFQCHAVISILFGQY